MSARVTPSEIFLKGLAKNFDNSTSDAMELPLSCTAIGIITIT